MVGDMYNIPHVISAETVTSLRARMLENNLLNATEFSYYQIVHDGRQFHAFYIKTAQEKTSILKKTKKTT